MQVRRTEIEQLRKFVTAYITGKVPTIVAPVLNPILTAYIELATEYLDKITAVTGTTTFVASHHVPKPPSPSPSPPHPSSSPPAPPSNGAKCTDLTNAAASAASGRATTVSLETQATPLAGLTICNVTVANEVYSIRLYVNTKNGAEEFAADRAVDSNVANLPGVGDNAFTSVLGVEALRTGVDIQVVGPAGPIFAGDYSVPAALAKAMAAAVR